MKRIWDTMGAVFVTALVVYLLVGMIKPYTGYILIGAVIVLVSLIAHRVYQRHRYW